MGYHTRVTGILVGYHLIDAHFANEFVTGALSNLCKYYIIIVFFHTVSMLYSTVAEYSVHYLNRVFYPGGVRKVYTLQQYVNFPTREYSRTI